MHEQTAICCTLNKVPMTAKSLEKSRLPFGLHLYPFAYDETIPVVTEGVVRCEICRAYINPYVRFCDNSWQCNLCNRLNVIPNEFIYDYKNKQYYDVRTKPEIANETVEYIASVEYMIRPPQPACYIFVFDCSKAAVDIGYIPIMATAIADLLDEIPGDARASIGFIAFDSNVHYFSFYGTQAVHHVCPDVTSTIIPCQSDGILSNMDSKREAIIDFLLHKLSKFPSENSRHLVTDTRSALGPAIKAAIKIMSPIGGKISVLTAQMPNYGDPEDGSVLQKRDPSIKSSDKNGLAITPLINPASDFYKNLALQCCEHQISIDLFNLAVSYVDLASISPMAKFTGGTVFHYANNLNELKSTLVRFDQDFRGNLIRPIGLESVLRLRHTKGLKIHTFHGNFFVRSPNLIVLPNANPDAAYALQIAIEEDLKPGTNHVFFQVSVLYTTPDGERRIRVHTARYETAPTLPDIIYGANQTAIVALLAKMAVDRSMQASIGEAKEALIGAGVDLLEIYSLADELKARSYSMGLPENLRSVPLYILALLKHSALRLDSSASSKPDDRYAAMERFKTLPIDDLITYIYPDLFRIHNIASDTNEDWKNPIQLTAAHIERNGAYLLDAYDVIIIYICEYIDPSWCHYIMGVHGYTNIPETRNILGDHQSQIHGRPRDPSNFMSHSLSYLNNVNSINPISNNPSNQHLSASAIAETPMLSLPELENALSVKLREFVSCLIDSRPQKPKMYVMKENNKARHLFLQYLVDDRTESYHSYPEFWKFLQDQACK